MNTKITILLCILVTSFFGCTYDTGASTNDDDILYSHTSISSSSSVKVTLRSSSSSALVFVTKSSSSLSYVSVFPIDLEYKRIGRWIHEFKLVMKNNTAYKMAVKINYEVLCIRDSLDLDDLHTRTVNMTFEPYEQTESDSNLDGYWHPYTNELSCTGKILSIVPTSNDESHFQSWIGSYPISTL